MYTFLIESFYILRLSCLTETLPHPVKKVVKHVNLKFDT